MKKNILFLGVKEFPYGSLSSFSKRGGGGTAKNAGNLIKGISKFHNIHLITQEGHPFYRNFILKNTHIKRIGSIDIKYFDFLFFHLNSFFHSLFLIKTKKIDIIYTNSFIGIFFGTLLSGIFQIPVFGMPRGAGPNHFKDNMRLPIPFLNRIYKIVYYFILSSVSHLIYLNASEKDFVNAPHLDKYQNYSIIPNAKLFPNSINPPKSNYNKIKLLFVGRLVPVKNIDFLIDAFYLLNNEFKDSIKLDIVGTGSLEQPLKKKVKDMGLSDKITFHGYKNNLDKYYSEASILILPSNMEGFPTVILEAASHGLACIVGPWGNNIFEKGTVHVLKNLNPRTIFDEVVFLINNIGYKNKISKKAFSDFKEKYSINFVIKSHLKLIKIHKL